MSFDDGKDEKGKPDRDSLMALQALLTIRTESMAESDSGSSPSPSRDQTSTSDGNPSSTSSTTTESGPTKPSSSQMEKPLASVTTPVPLPSQQAVPAQFNAPFVLPTQAQVAYGGFHPHGFHGTVQTPANGFAGYQLFVHPAPTTVLQPSPQPAQTLQLGPGTSTTQGSGINSTNPLPRTGSRKRKKAAVPPKISADSTGLNSFIPEPDESQIRKTEIEAALRSKPQRGRKRENLSAEERLELTRTRNREHAKSTRIRKKARYQELLDKEQDLGKMQNQLQLMQNRQQCISNFIKVRGTMLSNQIAPSRSTSPQVSNRQAVEEPLNGAVQNDRRVVSFTNETHPAAAVVDSSSFGNEGEGLQQPNPESANENRADDSKTPPSKKDVKQGVTTHKAVNAMKSMDKELAEYVREHYNGRVISSASYRMNDLVIGHEGMGYAEIAVVLQSPGCEDEVIKSYIMKMRFAEGSSKLSSMEWGDVTRMPLIEAPDAAAQGDSSSGDSSLDRQKSYPSVVSLDQSAFSLGENSSEKPIRKDSEGGNGPGMHII